MPRPLRSSPPSSSSDPPPPNAVMNATGTGTTGTGAAGDAAGFLQQLHHRLRSRCCPVNNSSSAATTAEPSATAFSTPDRPNREVTASVNAVAVTLPCLLQSWRRRIDCMTDRDDRLKPEAVHNIQNNHDRHHRHHHHHRPARCHRQRRGDRSVERSGDAALSPPESSTSSSTSSGDDRSPSPPPSHPPCLFAGFELPKLPHPRLERQRACTSLSGLWDSPQPSPDAGGAPEPPRTAWGPRCHPYWRGSDAK